MKATFRVILLIGILCAAGQAAVYSFQLDPADGVVQGGAGQNVGWGFTVTNSDAATWIVVSGAELFIPPAIPADPNFTDLIGPQFFSVGPAPDSPTWSQVYDFTLSTGVGYYTIPLTYIEGDSITGYIRVSYDVYSVSPNDPLWDPNTDTVSTGNFFPNLDVTVEVIPEPGSFVLAGGALLVIGALRRHRRRKPS